MTEEIEYYEREINSWFEKNTKLFMNSDLLTLSDYIANFDGVETKQINISNDYKFEYISSNFENIRPENVFKLNWLNICNKLSEYFPKIKINCMFEKASIIDNEIQKGNATFKHDVYITINNKMSDIIYDIALEYFEEKSHKKRSVDCDKKLYVQQIVDYYIIYKEKLNNMQEFYLNTIHKTMMLICSASDDHYTLSKINFFKNNQTNPKKLKKQTETFNKIISFHKMNKFNFNEFFIELEPKHPETEEDFEREEFIEFLEENYEITIKTDKQGNCDYSNFIVILELDSNISKKLYDYKKIYFEAMNIMLTSQKEIIHFINESTDKKLNLPDFLDTFLNNHIQSYRKKNTLKQVLENLTE